MADAVELTQPRIIDIEKMPEPKIYESTFGRIAAALGMTPEELSETWKSTPVAPPELHHASAKAGNGNQPKDVVLIPLYHGVTAARRDSREAVERGKVPVPTGIKAVFAVRVDGDCQSPEYPDGSTVVFSESESGNGLVEGADYIFFFQDGESTFKQLFYDREDRSVFILRARNPDRKLYPDQRVRREEISDVARAIWRMMPAPAPK